MQCVLRDPFLKPQAQDGFKGLKEDLGNMRAAIGRIEKNTLTLIDMSEDHRTELLLTRKVTPSSPSTSLHIPPHPSTSHIISDPY